MPRGSADGAGDGGLGGVDGEVGSGVAQGVDPRGQPADGDPRQQRE